MNAPDKIYIDGRSSAAKMPLFSSQNIEYIRKDCLIELLKSKIEEHKPFQDDFEYGCEEGHNQLIDDLLFEIEKL